MWDVIGDPVNKIGELCTAVVGNDASVACYHPSGRVVRHRGDYRRA